MDIQVVLNHSLTLQRVEVDDQLFNILFNETKTVHKLVCLVEAVKKNHLLFVEKAAPPLGEEELDAVFIECGFEQRTFLILLIVLLCIFKFVNQRLQGIHISVLILLDHITEVLHKYRIVVELLNVQLIPSRQLHGDLHRLAFRLELQHLRQELGFRVQ